MQKSLPGLETPNAEPINVDTAKIAEVAGEPNYPAPNLESPWHGLGGRIPQTIEDPPRNNDPEWKLSDETTETGKRNLPAARAAIQSYTPPEQEGKDEPTAPSESKGWATDEGRAEIQAAKTILENYMREN